MIGIATTAPPCPATADGSGGFEIMIKNNDRQRVPRKISETATLKIQRSLNEKQLALAAAAAAVAAERNPFAAPTSAAAAPAAAGCLDHAANSTANPAANADVMQPQQYHWSKTNVNSVYGGAAATDVTVEPSQQYNGHNANLTPSAATAAAADVNGKISGRSEPLGGNVYLSHHDAHLDVGATVPTNGGNPNHPQTHGAVANHSTAAADLQLAAFGVGGHRNSKINIILETAQAMAAAAYFTRFVGNTPIFIYIHTYVENAERRTSRNRGGVFFCCVCEKSKHTHMRTRPNENILC